MKEGIPMKTSKADYVIPAGINYGKAVVIAGRHNSRRRCNLSVDSVQNNPLFQALVNAHVGDSVTVDGKTYHVSCID